MTDATATRPTTRPAAGAETAPEALPADLSRAARALRAAWQVCGRFPFTTLLVLAVLVGALCTGPVAGPPAGARQVVATGYRAVITDGYWWTPVTSGLFTNNLGELLVGLAVTAVFVGAAERLMGTWRTAAVYVAVGYVGVYAGVGVQALFGLGDTFWTSHAIGHGSLDVIRPAMAVLVAASAFCGVLWRRRIRVVLILLPVVFVLYAGHPSDIYRLAAVLAGLLLGAGLGPDRRLMRWARSSHHEVRVLGAALVAITAAGPVIAVLSTTRFGVLSPTAFLSNGELLPDTGDPRCSLRDVTGACVSAAALRPAHEGTVLGVLVPAGLLLVVAFWMRRGRRWAVWTAIGVNGVLAVWAAVYFGLLPSAAFPAGGAHAHPKYWRTTLALAASVAAPAVVALLLFLLRRHFRTAGHTGLVRRIGQAVGLGSATGPGLGGAQDAARVRVLLGRDGGALAHMACWDGNRHWIRPDGRAGVAFQTIGQVSVTVGGPFGDPAAYEDTLEAFARHCDDHGRTAVFYTVDETLRPAFEDVGWHTLTVAEEAVIDLDTFTLHGNRNKDVRTAVNKARRTGLATVWTRWQDLSGLDRAQIADISEAWVADKALPEMSFTLGGLPELDDPDVHLMLASGQDGRVQAVTSWMPIHHHGRLAGWTLDFMRRRPDAPNGVMEFLIAETAAHAQADGLSELSLSGVPLARSRPTGTPTTLEHALDGIGRILEPHYGFNSLMRFKQKFHPAHRGLIMAYLDTAGLGAIGLALTRAYLPTLSLRQAARLLTARPTAAATSGNH